MNFRCDRLRRLTVHDAGGAGIAIAMSLVLVFGVVRPIANRNRQVAAHLQNSARERQRVAGLVTTVHALTVAVEKSRAELAASALRILPPDALNQRLADLAALANECNLTVQDLKPGDLIRGAKINTIPIMINGRGNYRNCAVFIHRMRDRLPDLDVCQFKLAGSPGDIHSTANFSFAVRWFTAAREPAQPPLATAGNQ